MGLLDFIFGKRTKIDHEFFGAMVFSEDKKHPEKSYFECQRNFAPTKKIIEIGIDGDLSGPSQIQVDFFKSIEDNYARIYKSISPMIEEEFANWQEGFSIANFCKEFDAVYLKIPGCKENPVVWEIAFESIHDRNHTFSLVMHDYDAKEILIDG